MEEFDNSAYYNILNTNELNNQEYKNYSIKPTKIKLYQKIKIKVFGHVFFKKIKLGGWINSLDCHIIKCKKHGYQLTYPVGWRRRLICRECLAEAILSK